MATSPAPQGTGVVGGRVWFAQALRGVAVLTVLVDHLAVQFFANNPLIAQFAHIQPLGSPVAPPGYFPFYGWLFDHYVMLSAFGVAVFFLVSGFVIPMSLERLSPGRFIVARAFRIYPVWLASLAVAAAAYVIYARFVPQAFPLSGREWGLNATLIYDWWLTPYVNPVVWTLAVEIKFYLLCALIAWAFGLHRMLPIASLCVALAAFAVLAEGRLEAVAAEHFHLFVATYVVAVNAKFLIFLFIGVCFYNLFRGAWDLRRFGAMTVLLSGLFVVATLTSPDPRAWKLVLLVTYTIALVVFGGSYLIREGLPYSRIWNYICDVSYPLYAVHYLVGIILLTGFYTLYPSVYLSLLLATTSVFVIVAVIHRYIEDPANRMGKQIRLPAPDLRREPEDLLPSREA